MRDTWPLLERIQFPPLRRGALDTLQINVGYRCNQSCAHCHVNAGPEPHRGDVAARSPTSCSHSWSGSASRRSTSPAARRNSIAHFRRLVTRRARPRPPRHGPLQPHDPAGARPGGPRRIPARPAGRDRRLDALLPGGQRRPPARQGRVRQLDPRPAAAQCAGLRPRRQRPGARSGVQSAGPVAAAGAGRRWRPTTSACSASATASCSTASTRSPTCRSSGSARSCSPRASSTRYLDLLQTAHLDANLDQVMCRNLISVDWQRLCLRLRFQPDARPADTAWPAATACASTICSTTDLTDAPIQVAGHCYGCTAGQGSSCGGALKEAAE